MEEVRQRLEAWERQSSIALQNVHSICAYLNDQRQGRMVEIYKQIQSLADGIALSHEVQGKSSDELVVAEESLKQANQRIEKLDVRVKECTTKRRHHEEIIARELSELGEKYNEKKAKLDLQQDAIAWYQKFIGFRVERSNGSALKIIHTKLDPNDFDREFSFTIRHDKHANVYTLLDCEPEVECSKELVDELNRTNELYKFIRCMRRQFQNMVSINLSC